MIGYVSKDDSYLADSTDNINSIKRINGTKVYLYDTQETKISIDNKWYDYKLPINGGGSGVINDKSITTEKFADDAKVPFAGTADIANSVESKNISDVTTVGKALLKANNEATARTAIGAGTSNLKIGTASTDAKAGNYVPTWNEISGKPSTFTPIIATSTTVGGVKVADYVDPATGDIEAVINSLIAAGIMASS